MATRKCGNICFPKYFMAVRPFLTRIFIQELYGLGGVKNIPSKFSSGTQSEDLEPSLTIQEFFFQKNIPGFICSVCVPFLGS